MARSRRNWTPQEDAFLRAAVQNALAQSRPLLWRELAKSVPGRSNKDCRRRWWNSLADGPAKGPWSEDEDERLMKAVQEHGANWSQVAVGVKSRNSDQCMSHWNHVLDPDIIHQDWTAEEDEQLLHAVLSYGSNWTTIAVSHTPRRTTLALKNRYSALRLKHENSNNAKNTISIKSLGSLSSTVAGTMTTCNKEQGMSQKAQEKGQGKGQGNSVLGVGVDDADENDEDGWDEDDEDVRDDGDDDCALSYTSLTPHNKEANVCAPGSHKKESSIASLGPTIDLDASNLFGLMSPTSSYHDMSHFCSETWMNDKSDYNPYEGTTSLDHTSVSFGSGYNDNGAIQNPGSITTSGDAMDFSIPFSPDYSSFTKPVLDLSPSANIAGTEVNHSIPTFEVTIDAVCTGKELEGLMVGLANASSRFTVKMKSKPSPV